MKSVEEAIEGKKYIVFTTRMDAWHDSIPQGTEVECIRPRWFKILDDTLKKEIERTDSTDEIFFYDRTQIEEIKCNTM